MTITKAKQILYILIRYHEGTYKCCSCNWSTRYNNPYTEFTVVPYKKNIWPKRIVILKEAFDLNQKESISKYHISNKLLVHFQSKNKIISKVADARNPDYKFLTRQVKLYRLEQALMTPSNSICTLVVWQLQKNTYITDIQLCQGCSQRMPFLYFTTKKCKKPMK